MFASSLVAMWLGVAIAAPPDELPEEEMDLDLDIDVDDGGPPEDDDLGFAVDKIDVKVDADDDDGMVDFVAEKLKKAPPPMWFHLDATGRQPLNDDWDIQVVAHNEEFMVLQLPVLVAQGRAQFDAAHPGGLLVETIVRSSGHEIVLNERVTSQSVYDSGPTWVFMHTALPHQGRSGDVRFVVRTADLPTPPQVDEEGALPDPPPPPREPVLKDRYARTTVFMRK